ncbi:MAG: class I SAM-dependent methyltransferase [Methylotenera sp.]
MNNMPSKGVAARQKIKLPPAILAVFIQIAALATVLFSVIFVHRLSAEQFSIFSLVVMQSIFAVLLCTVSHMAVWWRWIHGFFPLALYAMSSLTVPNEVYLFGFLITLSIFWTTFKSQVPFYPSRPAVWEKIAALIPQNQSFRLLEIGSGLGDLSMHVATVKPQSEVYGIEIAPMPWMISALRACLRKSSARFKLGNYHALNFGQYDMVFAYLSPAAMPALWEKAQQEMQVGSLLISYEFGVPEVPASFIIQDHHPAIYVWKM